MTITDKVSAARRLLALYQEKPFTQVKALLEAERLMAEVEQELQALAKEVDGNCCNSTGHRGEIIARISLTNDES